jgi:hypothetical protein
MPSLEASLRNLEKARAAWSHPPRPWRSYQETRIIKRLVWQWLTYRGPDKWSGRAVARSLGVSHTYIQKLVRQFTTGPSEMQREAHRHTAATFEHLNRAREETQQEKERGCLRGPIRFKLVRFTYQGSKVKAVVPTESERRRREAEASGRPLGAVYIPFHELPLWARGMPYYSEENACDPLVAVKYSMHQSGAPRPVQFARRWRTGRPFRQ